MTTNRNQRAGVEDRWFKTVHNPDGTTSTEETVRHGKGLRWMARWVDDEGKERSKSFSRKTDASDHLKTVIGAQVAGTYVDPKLGKITFNSFCKEWSKRQVWVASTKESVDQAIGCVTFGDTALNDLRTSDVETWIKNLEVRGLAPTTIKTRYVNVRKIIRAAKRDRLISHDVAEGVRLPRARKASAAMTIPTTEQIGALISGDGWLPVLVAVCAFAGLRKAEVSALKVSDIDFLRKEIHVERQVQFPTAGGAEVRGPKFGSERTVYVPEELLTILSEYIRVRQPGDDPTRWLFPGLRDSSNPIHRASLDYEWTKARATAKASTVKLHDLRHYFASGLIAAGCDVVTVQRAMGHASASITLNVYGHLWPDASDRTRKAAAGMLRAALAAPAAGQLRTGGQN